MIKVFSRICMREFYLYLLLILVFLNVVIASTIDGYALLNDTNNHSGIKILFESKSPSATTDSAYTDSTGYFSLALSNGLYNIIYLKSGYNPTTPLELFITESQTLDTVNINSFEPNSVFISGDICGQWVKDSIYYILDDAIINTNDTLTIGPGTLIKFAENKSLIIKGFINAMGTDTDSIRFTSINKNPKLGDWNSINFLAIKSGGRLFYCVIEYGGAEQQAASVHLWNSVNVMINNCSLRYNTLAICSVNLDRGPLNPITRIINNKINNNNCGISLCDAEGKPNIIIERNSIYNNDQAISVSNADAFIRYNSIFNNNIGLNCGDGDIRIINNTFYANNTHTALFSNEFGIIFKCNSVSNSKNAIRFGYLFNKPENLSYNNFYNNISNFSGDELPEYLGVLITTNINGDSADTYLNIFQNPKMFDPENFNFGLQEISPNIDAGDPELPKDPDSTIADIGAFYYNQATNIVINKTLSPSEFVLHQNYPNPFNPMTTISFYLPRTELIDLIIYNNLGKVVRKQICDLFPKGLHQINFDGSNLASGIYFYELGVGDSKLMKKMLLLK